MSKLLRSSIFDGARIFSYISRFTDFSINKFGFMTSVELGVSFDFVLMSFEEVVSEMKGLATPVVPPNASVGALLVGLDDPPFFRCSLCSSLLLPILTSIFLIMLLLLQLAY